MKKIMLGLILVILLPPIAMAGHSGFVDVGKITISTAGVEIVDANQIADGCSCNLQWNLELSHPNFNSLVSALRMAKATGK